MAVLKKINSCDANVLFFEIYVFKKKVMIKLSNHNGIRTHNHLVCKLTFNNFAKL